MSADRDVTPIVRSWLQDGVTSLPDHVLDRVFDQVPAIRQERGWLVGRRNPAMQNTLKLALAAAAVIAVVVAGLNLVPRSESAVIGPPKSPAASSEASTPTPPVPVRTEMFPGGFEEPKFSVLRPPGWYLCCSGTSGPGYSVIRGTTAPPLGMSVYFYLPATTFSDPCGLVAVDPPVGPTVDDLVQALREIPNISTTEPVASTIAGVPATYLEMTHDDTLPCEADQFYIWDRNWTQGPGQIVRTWVLEVDGSRLVVSALRYPEATAEMLAEQQSILDSLQFE